MFVEFFYHLRYRGLDVSPTEYLSMLGALQEGLIGTSLDRFYVVARSLLVKRVEQYDIWDEAFAEFFKDRPFTLEQADPLSDELLQWLEDPKALREMTDIERQMLSQMELDELRRRLNERMREQNERHDGGSHWVGTGGTSPFGHGGQNPAGIRVGGPEGEGSGGRSAVQVANERRFRNLRSDLKLDVRQIGVALRKLRMLTREGHEEELDLDGTIAATARNAGDLEIVMQPPRANRVKLLLLMDVGGSMTPYTRLCSQLFSAAHQATHFKQFQSYYFHNCPYGTIYSDMARREGVSLRELIDHQLDASWRCIIVGDAAMAPGELMYAGGAIDLYYMNKRSGLSWLREIKEVVPRTVWLNPDPVRYWGTTYTTVKIREVFEMYPLTLDGLEDAVRLLRRKRAA